jgi:hypothetical protein
MTKAKKDMAVDESGVAFFNTEKQAFCFDGKFEGFFQGSRTTG